MTGNAALWHDLEHCGYSADLGVWRRILRAGGVESAAELGAGTGRITLRLAADGFRMTAIDRDAGLLSALRARLAPGMAVDTVVADARSFSLDRPVDAVLMPALLLQFMPDRESMDQVLRASRRQLSPGGLLAVAIDRSLPTGSCDLRRHSPARRSRIGGRAFIDQPDSIAANRSSIAISRLRCEQRRTPIRSVDVLQRLTMEELAALASRSGFESVGLESVPPSGFHSGIEVAVFNGC